MKINSKLFNPYFIILTSLFFVACENDIAKVNSITAELQNKLPIESGKNVEIIYSDSAKVKAKLTAPQLDRYITKKSQMVFPKGLAVIFYDGQQKQKNKLTANYGVGYDNGTQLEKMEVKNNVVVVNEKGDKLETEHLTWNAATQKIFTDKFVKITTKEEVIWGDGLEANQDFSEYEIKNVKGQLSIKEEEFKN
ncbi:MAG: LPS export ABC transporter periplasmic protein LptC [Bacteroidia bacterium]|nr:LPS export ABC transporter periplasmic protein LptC [Bacteroidia bacterium]